MSKRIPTTYHVWAAIKDAHPELKVFGSFSAPHGDYFGNPAEAIMETTYGFEGYDFALIGAKTTWDVDREDMANRPNEKHEYYLFAYRDEEL